MNLTLNISTIAIKSHFLFFLILFFLLNLLLPSPYAYAEYRVYQYFVKPKIKLVQDKNAYLVTSSLDPVSYVTYHGGNDSMKVSFLRTWICPGFTGQMKDYCEGPYKSINKEENLSR